MNLIKILIPVAAIFLLGGCQFPVDDYYSSGQHYSVHRTHRHHTYHTGVPADGGYSSSQSRKNDGYYSGGSSVRANSGSYSVHTDVGPNSSSTQSNVSPGGAGGYSSSK